jgi:hypothetical protein
MTLKFRKQDSPMVLIRSITPERRPAAVAPAAPARAAPVARHVERGWARQAAEIAPEAALVARFHAMNVDAPPNVQVARSLFF